MKQPLNMAIYMRNLLPLLLLVTTASRAVAKMLGGGTPRIERFAIAEMFSKETAFSTLRIKGRRIERVPAEDDPFALHALPANEQIRSDGFERNGYTVRV